MTREEAEKILVEHFPEFSYSAIVLWLQSMGEEQYAMLEAMAAEHDTDAAYELVQDFRSSFGAGLPDGIL